MSAHDQARDVVGRRLLGAAYREDLSGWRTAGLPGPAGAHGATHHGFDRIEITTPVTATPAELLDQIGLLDPTLRDTGFLAELDDAVTNLAIAYGRRAEIDAQWRKRAAERDAADAYGVVLGDRPDEQAIAFERLATDGHNLHPCGRTRLGWDRDDVLAYDQESDGFDVGFVAMRRDTHVGDDVGDRLRAVYPGVPVAPAGYVIQPVHPWQLTNVLRTRHADLFTSGALREATGAIHAAPTTALRTVLLEPDRFGARRYLKLSLDIQVTSTRRSISIASTRNGPPISTMLASLVDDERLVLMPESAGAAMSPGRDVAAIVREALDPGRLDPGDVALPGAALPAISPITGRTLLAELVDRFGAARGSASPALDFIDEYARLLLPPLLRLLDAGVGLEAHLQNSIPIFHDGIPVRMAFRDFAGLRLHLPRLATRTTLRLWPDSVIGTIDVDVVRAKLGYTALQAHLGEIVLRLTESHGLDESAAWRRVRDIVESVYAGGDLDPDDRAFFLAPTMPHKALVRMRLQSAGDVYVPVRNPLHDR